MKTIGRDINLFSYPFTLRKNNCLPFPFNQENIFFCGYARTALYEGLKLLGINTGDGVLVPDYICGATLSPMRFLGIKTRYYTLKEDLNPDWQHIIEIIDENTKALLIVNYFGFPNDLEKAKDFCRQHSIYLIEDNAHGYLSYNNSMPLGSYGDISIFSFRKTLPIPNGAALLVNNASIDKAILSEKKYTANRPGFLRFIVKSLIIYLKNALPLRQYNKFRNELCEIASGREKKEEFNLEEYFLNFHPAGHSLLKYLDFSSACQQRRQAYLDWLEYFSQNKNADVQLPFSSLKEGVAPYVFPVLAENRQELMLDMYKQDIETFPWPTLPADSQENYFSRKMVCLPLLPAKAICRWSKNEKII